MILPFFDWFGMVIFAISGALAARHKRIDPFGGVVLGVVTAVGGGTVRDLLLGLTPVFWVREPLYIAVPALVSLATFALMEKVRFPPQALLVCDAIGLGVFTVSGCERALAIHPHFLIVIVMGALSGVAGGAIRDLLCGEIPTILQREIYATASLAGAALFHLSWWLHVPYTASVAAGAVTATAIRLVTLFFKATLPVAGNFENQ